MGRPFLSQDMSQIRYLSSPTVTADGEAAAWVVTTGDEESGRFFSQIMVLEGQGEPVPLPAPEGSSQTQPSFLSRDVLAYLSDEGGRRQIYLYHLRGGEKRQLTTTRHGVARFRASEGAAAIAFELELWPEDVAANRQFTEMTGEEAAAWAQELEYRPYEITDLTYKMDEWYGMRRGQLPQIAVVDLQSGDQTLLSSFDLESTYPVLSPDGEKLAFYGYPYGGAKGRRPELFLCSARDGGGLRQLTRDMGVYADTYPAFTPRGDETVFMAVPELADESTIILPYAVDLETGATRQIIQETEDQICHGIHPFPIGRTEYGETNPYYAVAEDSLYFLSSWRGRESIYRKPLHDANRPVELVLEGETAVHAFAVSPAGPMVFTMANLTAPAELYIQERLGAPAVRRTDSNPWLADFQVPETEEFWIKSKDGKADLQVWLMRPAGQEEGKLYPAVLYVHGGPETTYNAEFWHEFLALSHAGMAVIYANPRGSLGYGRQFCADGIAWKPEAMDDLVSAVEACVERGFIDKKRIGITGGSYGGYMTNKFIGRTKHFAAAVTQRSLVNPATSYGTGDMGFISANPEAKDVKMLDYLLDRARGNAITYIDNMKVPLLLLHGYRDYRCSFEQAEQLFIAMRDRNPEVPVRLVMFPEENHGVDRTGKLYNQIRHLQEMCDWFEKYLAEGGAANE